MEKAPRATRKSKTGWIRQPAIGISFFTWGIYMALM
jgi:hypothetical protein